MAREREPKLQVPRWLASASELSARLLIVGVALFVALLLVARLRVVVLPAIFALLLATALAPPVKLLERYRVPALAATWIVMVAGLAVLGAIVYFVAVALIGELGEVGRALAAGWDNIVEWLRGTPLGGAIGDPIERIAQELRERSGQIVRWALQGISTTIELLAMVILTLFFTFFFLKDGDDLTCWAIERFGRRNREAARESGRRAWAQVGRFIRGQILIAAIVASANGLALWILDVPLIPPLMLITFVGDFIPFAGPVFAAFAGALVALTDEGLVQAALVVLAAFVIQQLEGNVLEPLILGKAVRLHPTAIAAAVTAGAVIAGLIGAFLAVPVLTTVIALVSSLKAVGGKTDRREAA